MKFLVMTVVAVVVCFGAGFLKSVMGIPDHIFWPIYWISIAAIVIGAVLINVLSYRAFMKKVNALLPILTEEKDQDRYITENQALLQKKKSEVMRATLLFNICAGYCEKREFAKAKESLLQINQKKLRGMNGILYHLDLAYVNFYLKENEEALAIMRQNRGILERLADSGQMGPMVSILNIFEQLAIKQYKEAKALYAVAVKKFPNEGHVQSDYAYLAKRLGLIRRSGIKRRKQQASKIK